MTTDQTQALRTLITSQPIAALGTVQNGEPFVSMVPFAVLADSAQFIVHVSALAAHTQHMLENPSVSWMVMAMPAPDVSAQATPRVSIQGLALQLNKANAKYEQAKAAYLARFPQSLDLFGFSDFSLFALQPSSARFVAGFARALSLNKSQFLQILSQN